MREEVSGAIVGSSGVIRELRAVRMRLEDIFVRITKEESSEESYAGRQTALVP